MKFMASCTAGLESPLAYEIKDLGLDVIDASDGKVLFEGPEEILIRASLWLRTAERLFIILDEFQATTSDELFERLYCHLFQQIQNLHFLYRELSFRLLTTLL